MTKEEFIKLPVLDQLKYSIEESLEDHKKYNSQYWKGSAFMGRSVLDTIEKIKQINNIS